MRATCTTTSGSSDGSTNSEILFHKPRAETESDKSVPLHILLEQSTSYAAVDNSGSTAGATLKVAQVFVDNLGVSLVSLWNSFCDRPMAREDIKWRSTGCTDPSKVFHPVCHVPENAPVFVFATDGEVNDTASLAIHAHVTVRFPSVGIFYKTAD